MISSYGFLDSDLYHSLMSEYSFPIYNINFPLPDEMELEKTKEYKQLSYEEACLFLTETYENAWFDFILLQKYCKAYINQPSLYGAPGYFDSFRQRYQIFDYYPVHGKMNENAELEKRLLCEHYSNKDSNGFDASFHEFTKKSLL